MTAVGTRPALLALLLAASALTGCSSSGSSASSGPSQPARAAASSDRSTGASGPAGSSASGAAGGSPRPSGRASTPLSVPSVTASSVAGVRYVPASSGARARLAPVMKASGGLLTGGSVKSIRVGGHEVGAVGVYTLKPGVATSPTFQGQYVVQLVNAVAHDTAPPRFVRANGRVLAMSTSATAVVGWFEGDKVVLVYRSAGAPDLTGLALGVHRAGLPA